MKIQYSTNFGKFTSYDFSITSVTALVSADEHLLALGQGFIWRNQEWQQCRSTRVCLADTSYRLYESSAILTVYDYDELMIINKRYLSCRGYEYNPADVHISPHDTIWGYYHNDMLIAWSRIHNYNGARETAYFAWDSIDMNLRIGTKSLQHEIAWAKELNDEYLYLGPGYESCSIYKSRMQGFEWWTGSEWSHDLEQYTWLCERETSVNNFKEFETIVYNAK